jgi:hypothetical protein
MRLVAITSNGAARRIVAVDNRVGVFRGHYVRGVVVFWIDDTVDAAQLPARSSCRCWLASGSDRLSCTLANATLFKRRLYLSSG